MKGLGYISKDDQETALKELRDQIAEMRQQGTQSEEMRFQNQEAEARSEVGSWLSAAGIKDDGTGLKQSVVETLIKDWINNSEERIEKWSRGGVSAKTLVKEGFDFAMKALDWKATRARRTSETDGPGLRSREGESRSGEQEVTSTGNGERRPKDATEAEGAYQCRTARKGVEDVSGRRRITSS